MRKLKDLFLDLFVVVVIVISIAGIGYITYNLVRPVETIKQTYTVKTGDTWYGICDVHYIVEDNADCFNEFWYRNMSNNGDRQLHPGDVITIVNKVYK